LVDPAERQSGFTEFGFSGMNVMGGSPRRPIPVSVRKAAVILSRAVGANVSRLGRSAGVGTATMVTKLEGAV
jgi:hypothetical protein